MGDLEAAQKVEELLDAGSEPDGSDSEVTAAWERQRRVHLLLHARFGGDADATYASIRAAASGTRRERIADGIGRRTGRRMRRFSWQRYVAPVAAAALLLIAVLVGRSFLNAPPATPTVAEATMVLERIGPDLVVQRDQQRLMPDAGMLLQEGDLVMTGGSGTRVAFSDGTQVDLAAGTRARFRQQHGKVLNLQAGLLTGDVTRQPPDRPLRITSPGSHIEVVGTRFTLGLEPSGTRLTVEEGTVRMSDKDNTRPVAVTVGQQALGSWFRAPRLVAPFDATTLTERLRLSTDDPETWVGKMYGPISAERHQDPGAPAHLRLGITANARDGWGSRGIKVRMQDGDQALALRLRVRSASPGNVIAFDMADDVGNTWRLGEMPMAPGAGWQQYYIPVPPTDDPPPHTTQGTDNVFRVSRLYLLWFYIRGVAEVDVSDLVVLTAP